MKLALISDIHGNSWALTEVLKDLEKRKPDMIVNLGDTFYGPLDPRGTFDLMKPYAMISVSGNEDRIITEDVEERHNSPTLQFVRSQLPDEGFYWLQALKKTESLDCGALLCHGTPDSDTTYLVEKVLQTHVGIRDDAELDLLLSVVRQSFVFCGYSHRHNFLQTTKHSIVNPGSVGLQAYDDDMPVFHVIENFNTCAYYCMVELSDNDCAVEHIAVPYDFDSASMCAAANGRSDWAKWLKTGRA